jgi:hypothetical protein
MHLFSKIGFILAATFLCLVGYSQQLTISILPQNAVTTYSTVVEIPWDSIANQWPTIDTAKIIVTDISTGKQIPFQLQTLQTGSIIHLLVQQSITPNKATTIQISYGKRQYFEAKTFGRFVPERKDDFAWENDKIAFRMYGKALEQTPNEMAYGIDVWVKRVPNMIINKRYQLADYHTDNGDGLDYYSVGKTCGAGNIALWLNDSIQYDGTFQSFKIQEQGLLRTVFTLYYKPVELNGKLINIEKTIQIDAGTQLNKITAHYSNNGNTPIAVAMGNATRQAQGVKYINEVEGVIAYWEPKHPQHGTTGVGCIVPLPTVSGASTTTQLIAKTSTNADGFITYYAGAAWDKAGEITTAKQWIDYLSNYRKNIHTQFRFSFQYKTRK